jgi:hypothetical protein
MRVVKTFIERLRFAFRHVTQHVGPDPFGCKISDLHASNGFHIRRNAFLNPMMLVGNVRKGRVDEFVGHQPIFMQLLPGCMPTYEDTSKRWVTAPSFSTERATLSFGRIYANPREGNRKNAVVMCDCVSGL